MGHGRRLGWLPGHPFTLRINREISVGEWGEPTWLPIADIVNMLSLAVTLIGVFILPVLGAFNLGAASRVFGLAALLLVGYAIALAGHYELYTPWTRRSMRYFPSQERFAIAVVAIAAIAYVVVASTI